MALYTKMLLAMKVKSILEDRKTILSWYHENKRMLPWRKSRDPYKIWISEVMLQQTTVAAVVPYFERFIKQFPNVESLAKASLPDVYEMWAGLGYYSRARNLHKSAQIIATEFNTKFPKTAEELLQLPGFGPYTSRAVASLAFSEKVGVLDGNVIRILCRRYGLSINWWNSKERQQLQNISDTLAETEENAHLNQALMELGATVCTPKKPLCLLCPWKKQCVALKNDLIDLLPKSKPKEAKQIWHWQMQIQICDDKVYLEPATVVPFLKNQWFPKGTAKQLKQKPKQYDLTHSVTKYKIYVSTHASKATRQASLNSSASTRMPTTTPDGLSAGRRWVPINQLKQVNPTSLMTKVLNSIQKKAKLKQ